MRQLWLWGPAVLFMALLFTISAAPVNGDLPGGISDKAAHFIGYAILSVLVLRALTDGFRKRPTLARAVSAVAVAVLFGMSDEFHQGFVPSRHSDVMDLLADAAGATAGVVLALFAFLLVRRRTSQQI